MFLCSVVIFHSPSHIIEEILCHDQKCDRSNHSGIEKKKLKISYRFGFVLFPSLCFFLPFSYRRWTYANKCFHFGESTTTAYRTCCFLIKTKHLSYCLSNAFFFLFCARTVLRCVPFWWRWSMARFRDKMAIHKMPAYFLYSLLFLRIPCFIFCISFSILFFSLLFFSVVLVLSSDVLWFFFLLVLLCLFVMLTLTDCLP